MDNLFDVIMQAMKSSFPKLNWKLGSVIRTLLVDPLTKISEEVDKYTSEAAESLDIEAIVRDPIGREADLDIWLSRLGISLPDPVPATGSVAIIVNSDEDLIIPAGAAFTWGDDVALYTLERTDWNKDNFKKIAEGVYRAEVAVSTVTGSAISIGTDEPLNWSNAPDTVEDIYVLSPICGGHENSAQEKADLIRATLTAPGAFGEESIKSALIRKYGNVICDAKLGPRTEAKGRNVVPVYIKQSAEPEVLDIPASPSYNADGDLEFRVDTSAVVSMSGIWTTNGVPVAIKTKTQTGTLGDTGSYCTLTIADPGVALKYTVRITRYSASKAAIDWFNSTQSGLPFQMKAKLPRCCDIHLSMNLGGEQLNAGAKAAICGYVNQSTLGGTLSTSSIQSILSEYNYSLKSPVLFVGFLIDDNGTSTSASQTGSFVYTGQFSNTPVAMYCNAENIYSY